MRWGGWVVGISSAAVRVLVGWALARGPFVWLVCWLGVPHAAASVGGVDDEETKREKCGPAAPSARTAAARRSAMRRPAAADDGTMATSTTTTRDQRRRRPHRPLPTFSLPTQNPCASHANTLPISTPTSQTRLHVVSRGRRRRRPRAVVVVAGFRAASLAAPSSARPRWAEGAVSLAGLMTGDYGACNDMGATMLFLWAFFALTTAFAQVRCHSSPRASRRASCTAPRREGSPAPPRRDGSSSLTTRRGAATAMEPQAAMEPHAAMPASGAPSRMTPHESPPPSTARPPPQSDASLADRTLPVGLRHREGLQRHLPFSPPSVTI